MRPLRAYLKERDAKLARYPDKQTNRIFLTVQGFALTTNGAEGVFRRLGQVAGVANFHPHRARHTFCTQYLTIFPGDDLGLRRIVGHLSLAITADYVHLSQSTIARRANHASVVESLATPRIDPREQARQRKSMPLLATWGVIREPVVVPPPPQPERRVVVQQAKEVAAEARRGVLAGYVPIGDLSADEGDHTNGVAIKPRFCPACGRPRGEDHRFCAGCGRAFEGPS
jgi:hypothetical protein